MTPSFFLSFFRRLFVAVRTRPSLPRLRTLKRFPEMRLLVESLMNSVHLLLVGIGVVCTFNYVFAVYGRVAASGHGTWFRS